MTIKYWNGSAFVDPSQVRYWDGSAFVAPQAIYEWVADEFIKRWPASITYRMNKVGESHAFASQVPVRGWESDATEPGPLFDGLLTGSGVTTVEVSLSVKSGSGYSGSVLVKLDGVTIITIDAYNLTSYTIKTGSWTGVATEGQQVTVETSTVHGVGVNAPSFVRVTSAVPHKVSWADGFNRANTTSSVGLGDNWWNFSSYGLSEYPSINGNQATGAGGASVSNSGNGAAWKEPVPAGVDNYFVEAYIPSLSSGSTGQEPTGLLVRANESSNHYNNTPGSEAVFFAMSTGNWRVYRARTAANSGSTNLQTGSMSNSAGGTLRVEVHGDLMIAKYKDQVITAADITGIGEGRQVGIHTNGSNAKHDDFASGQCDPVSFTDRQRIEITTPHTVTTGTTTVLGWTTSADEDALVSDNSLLIAKSNSSATVSCSIQLTSTQTSGTTTWTLIMLRNGTAAMTRTFATTAAGQYTIEDLRYNGPVAVGDRFHITALRSGGTSPGGTVTTGTTLRTSEMLPPLRQRMTKSGTASTLQNPVTGWTSSNADAPSWIDTNKLRVQGRGAAEIYWQVDIGQRSSAQGRTQQLWHNGTLIDEFIPDPSVNMVYQRGPFQVAVENDDLVYMATTGTSVSGGGVVNATTTFIEVGPRS
ncbi:hypothetical protein BH762_gp131 [Gordonia phage OneUp]|uniref:Uncharacterized protein n=1 Tax=Gordonia phage OneUp TaxID=1838074 RepID=A0A160DET6_9CAUD|nr:hypothetical protein BH762_gp131 [Gordonia phage OneUp]ANA86388.1 hypothetical protein PBI_ONEUP_53 [Gordonia phage OneUp]